MLLPEIEKNHRDLFFYKHGKIKPQRLSLHGFRKM
jgi:hypothetical protein